MFGKSGTATALLTYPTDRTASYPLTRPLQMVDRRARPTAFNSAASPTLTARIGVLCVRFNESHEIGIELSHGRYLEAAGSVAADRVANAVETVHGGRHQPGQQNFRRSKPPGAASAGGSTEL